MKLIWHWQSFVGKEAEGHKVQIRRRSEISRTNCNLIICRLLSKVEVRRAVLVNEGGEYFDPPTHPSIVKMGKQEGLCSKPE